MRRLLTSLYNLFVLMVIRSEIKRRGKVSYKYPAGPFFDLPPEALFYMTNVMYDEEQDIEIRMKYICSCDEYVYQMGAEGSYACIHCDSVCQLQNCEVCHELRSKDLWEDDANL